MQVYTLKLSDFLRTGCIGELETGISRQRVRDLLGEPTDWLADARTAHGAAVWKYGTLEIGFTKSDAVIGYISFEQLPDQTTPVQFTDGVAELLSCREDFERYLSREKVGFWQDKNDPNGERGVCLIIECKTKIYFEDNDFSAIFTHECR